MVRRGTSSTAAAGSTRKVYPFVEKNIACPICGVQEAQRRMKSNLFAERGRDIDLRPLEYVTTVKGVEEYLPPLYYISYCAKCLFAAGYMFYEDPFQDSAMTTTKVRSAVSKAREAGPTKAVFEKLGCDIDSIPRDYLQAMKLHLLAIYNLEMVEQIAQTNTMNLGRYYLRTAWLFHDIFQKPDTKKDFGQKVQNLVSSLSNHWKAVPDGETSALKKAVSWFEQAVVSSYAIKTPLDQVELLLLIARIHMKLGNIPQARKYLQSGKDSARKSQEQIEQQIREDSQNGSKLSDQKISQMRGMVRKLEAVADHAQNVFEDVRGEWEDKEMEKGKAILAKYPGKSQEALRELLVAGGVDEMIARKLTPSQKKKKGLFGLFG